MIASREEGHFGAFIRMDIALEDAVTIMRALEARESSDLCWYRCCVDDMRPEEGARAYREAETLRMMIEQIKEALHVDGRNENQNFRIAR